MNGVDNSTAGWFSSAAKVWEALTKNGLQTPLAIIHSIFHIFEKNKTCTLPYTNPAMKFIFSLLILCSGLTLTAQPGTPDNSFGTNGKVIENLSAPHVEVLDEVIQTDGKIIVLADAAYNNITHPVLIRYNTDGTPDITFSGDGIADSPLAGPGNKEYPAAIRLQADGKILICGSSYDTPGNAFVARYNTDGSLDAGFGSTGVVYIQNPEIYQISDLVVLPNGQMVLLSTGNNYLPNAPELVLIRLNSDGSLNSAFGNGGIAALDIVQNATPVYSRIVLQTNGKLVIGGTRNQSGFGNDDSVLLVRVNTDGTLDNTYGTNGVFTFDPGPETYEQFSDMVIQPDDKILTVSYGANEDKPGYTIITRTNTNGSNDSSFGVNGVQYISASTTGFGCFGQISLQDDGAVLIGGFAKNALSNYTMAVARLTTSGILDLGFDGDGIALLQVNNYGSYGIAPRQQADGNIVIAGYAGNGSRFSATIGRFTATGLTDNTIDAGSTAIAYIGSGSEGEEGRRLLVQPDQHILNIRVRGNGFSYNLGLSRHLPNGTPDSSFGVSGEVVMDLPGLPNKTFAGLLTNGKTMAVLDVEDFAAGHQIGLLRFNADGSPDSSFATNGKLFFTTTGNGANRVTDASVQPDGTTVILSTQSTGLYEPDTTLLIRLNTDGSYDNTFNNSGKLVLPLYDNAAYKKLLVQADGKILPAYTQRVINNFHTFITRLNIDGTTDATFNAGNALETPVDAHVTAIQPDGKMLLAGTDSKIVRLNSDGSFDTGFDGDGIAEPAYHFDTYEGIMDIQLQADGKILLSGSGHDTGSDSTVYRVARIDTGGALDMSFGAGGIANIPMVAGNYHYNTAMALQADEKILLAGYSENQNEYYTRFAMARLNNMGFTYTFTGNGAWDIATNWSNNAIPPATLPSGSSIVIDPVAGGECILTVMQHVAAGAMFTVKTGKQFRIAEGLILQ